MDVPVPVEPNGDTRSQILAATYAAIAEHGYADLSMQHIADEFPKSKSLVYHHYDGKDNLLLDFLEFLQSQFETLTSVPDDHDPAEQLQEFLDVFAPREPGAESTRADELASIYVQLRAQAVQDPRYADVFRAGDERIRDRLLEIIRAGVEAGTFEPSGNPEAIADFLRYAISGAMIHRATGDDATPAVREELEAYLDERLRS